MCSIQIIHSKNCAKIMLICWFCRSLVGRMNLDGSGSSIMASHHRSKDSRPESAGVPLKSQAVGREEDSYDDEEFESVGSPGLSSTHETPRLSWMGTDHDMIDVSTQTVVHSGLLVIHFRSVIKGAQCWLIYRVFMNMARSLT